MNGRQIEQWCQLHSRKAVTELRLQWDFPRQEDQEKVRQIAPKYRITFVKLFESEVKSEQNS